MARNTVLSRTHNIYRNLHTTGLLASLFPCNYVHQPSTFTRNLLRLFGNSCKVCSQRSAYVLLRERRCFHASGCAWIHAGIRLRDVSPELSKDSKPGNTSEDGASVALGVEKVKCKKLKGKRAVVRWLKSFRWRKKKEYERMSAEEKILYKLKKARNREDRLVAALKKIDPPDTTETTHDPEILTPEEHFYFLKMGHKARNYVPIGRRGIYQGVILNMHLHWKKHLTLKVKVKTFTPEEVREIAAELARLSGGIVLEIHEENTIIMYRGKNYVQPPTEIMSPKVTLPRKKALDKSKYRDALRAVRQFIPRLEQNLELLKEQHKRDTEGKNLVMAEEPLPDSGSSEDMSSRHKLAELLELKKNEDGVLSADDSLLEPSKLSESEDLSDIFETDSEGDYEEKEVKPLYLDEIERFPSQNVKEPENFEEHLRKIFTVSKNSNPSGKNVEMLELDEIDKLFLQAGSLLKKKR